VNWQYVLDLAYGRLPELGYSVRRGHGKSSMTRDRANRVAGPADLVSLFYQLHTIRGNKS
jgi:hypothetical protein